MSASASPEYAKFDAWLASLETELNSQLGLDGHNYIKDTGVECWRDMYDAGLTPAEAASEEAYAIANSL